MTALLAALVASIGLVLYLRRAEARRADAERIQHLEQTDPYEVTGPIPGAEEPRR